jgi:hypothetical protein
MKYAEIIKYAQPDENGNKYELVLRYPSGNIVKPCYSTDVYRSYIEALIWAHKWNKMMRRNAKC